MYKFPEGLYCDVRIEKVRSTLLHYLKGELSEMRERDTVGAFVRVYDGSRWYIVARIRPVSLNSFLSSALLPLLKNFSEKAPLSFIS